MSRKCSFPSTAQVEKLLECLEERSYLVTGYARTSHARNRTRAAWQDIALKLNSDSSGCIKTGPQWAKYWKDKKAGVKSKASKIKMARQRTSGDHSDDFALSVIEQRIVGLMGGTGFTNGDRKPEIDPLHFDEAAASPCSIATPCGIATPPAATIPSAEQLSHVDSASPRRHLAANRRRRLAQRKLPAQRHSQMANLTERFLAIEEKRLENEVNIIHSQKKIYELFLDIAKAMSNQTEAIKELCQATRALAERKY